MIRKILKSVLVLTFLGLVTVGATRAWFTSSVTAADNEIVAGTLRLAVDAGDPDTNGKTWGTDAWNVAYQSTDGSVVQKTTLFPTWEEAEPGTTYSYYMALRNLGSVPANIRFNTSGEWLSGPRFGQYLPGPDGVSDTTDDVYCPLTTQNTGNNGWPKANLAIKMNNIHQFASINCEGENGCLNLYYGLTSSHPTHHTNVAGISAGNRTGYNTDGWYYGVTGGGGSSTGNLYGLEQYEFAVYRIDMEFDGDADTGSIPYDCLQGATYQFDINTQAKQAEPAASWPQ
jgi:predicted ribosomally synthesized peptide with SipW-like signal peptide